MKLSLSMSRVALVTAGVMLGVTACSDSQTALAPTPRGRVPVNLEISSLRASIGDRVSVALHVGGAPRSVGGVQGRLHFDASRLRYIGQVADDQAIAVVNDQQAASGELRFASFRAGGIGERAVTFVFETKAPSYEGGLSYMNEVAAGSGSRVSRMDVELGQLAVVPALGVSSDARRMTIRDWAARLGGSAPRTPISARPGEIRPNLMYGDVDFDGAVGLLDFLDVANVAVGNNNLIVNTDGPAEDVDRVIAGNVSPLNVGKPCGVETDDSRTLDLLDFLSIANDVVGFDDPCVGTVIPGRAPTSPANVTINATSTPDLIVGSGETLTLTSNTIWTIDGTLEVQDGGTLVVQPGTLVQGTTNGAIFIDRGGIINASGTLTQPIVFTCSATVKAKGCWGGIFLAGKARVNEQQAGLPPSPFGGNQRQGEGNGPLYGGNIDNDNSGVLRYVRIEYGGRVVSANNELNNLTLAAVGSGTTIDYVQIHGGTDDGVEFFGGTVNVRHLLLTGNDDDGFDWSFGYHGDAQFVIVQSDRGDITTIDSKALEGDNTEPAPGTNAQPRTAPNLFNFTIIGNLAATQDDGAIQVRRGNGSHIANFLVIGYPIGLDINDPLTCDTFGSTQLSIKSTTFIDVANLGNNDADAAIVANAVCPAGATAGENEEAFILAEPSNRVRTGALSVLIDPLNTDLPDWRMLTTPLGAPVEGGTQPAPAGSTIQTVDYRGAVAPAATAGTIPWYSGWTRPFQTATAP